MAERFDGWKIAQERIAREAIERTGKLDLAGLDLEEIPKEVARLTHLRELDLGQGNNLQSNPRIVSLEPLSGLVTLQSLDCSSMHVSDLAPLSGHVALQSLDCGYTPISDLAPLSGLVALQRLYCSSTQVSDLAPLAGLVALQRLYCSSTQVSDLAPLARLVALQSLRCFNTQVSDLAPLSGLVALQSLDCFGTQVSDLAPLSGLVALQSIDCSSRQVSDLAPLAGLVALQSIDCSGTQVSDLAPLAGLVALQSLDCGATEVSDLAPLSGLPELAHIGAQNCGRLTLPRALIETPSLKSIKLWGSHAVDIPSGLLAASYRDNCLPSLRAYFAESRPDDPRLEDVKLMALGNGRVGKTQLASRLLGRPYDPNSRSTHGVVIERCDLPRGDGEAPIPLHIWDFGGQDIYHGTHALFLRDHAIFALVWARDFEAESDDPADEHFGNRPLRYWADYVRHASGTDRAVIAVQTRCDSARDEAALPMAEAELRETFGHFTRVEVSAAKPRGIEHLREKLAEAAEYALEQEGRPRVPAAWARVKDALEAWRAEDRARPEAERVRRTLTTNGFAALCRKCGVTSEPKHLLQYLHRSGVVFHRPELTDRIVLDQTWALEAIYAVFNRDNGAWRGIRRQNGRFTPEDLAVTAWADRRADERALFLGMMLSCGVCFELWEGEDGERELIAPEGLPARAEVEAGIRTVWDTDQSAQEQVYRYAFLHEGLIRALIAEIGRSARGEGVYWRDGVAAFETVTGARAMIEQTRTRDGGGEIAVRTRGGKAAELLATLRKQLEQTQRRLGLAGEPLHEPAPAPPAKSDETQWGRDMTAPLRCYISYAWADKADPLREAEVDRLCAAADKTRFDIRRDKTELTRGDSITDFMREIGKGDRVFVFLSDKYLRSPFCMFELFAIWDHSRRDDEDFRRRVRLFVLGDAKIWKKNERRDWAAFWFDEFHETEKVLKEKSPLLLGSNDFEAHRRTLQFYMHIGHVLERFADRLQPRDFDDFLKWGFDDPAA